jgi:hypothetical protein
MTWQADFYRRPLQDEAGNPLWELVVCRLEPIAVSCAFCPQPLVSSGWIVEQLRELMATEKPPDRIQVFRPQAFGLIETACQILGMRCEPTRRTPELKQVLQERAKAYAQLAGYTTQPYEPVKLEQAPPVPLPEHLWGEQWRFAAIAASDLEQTFRHRPIPIASLPPDLLPLHLQLASTTIIPGVVIDGGRQSMQLARWLHQAQPYALQFIPGAPDGLVLEAGLSDRWVLATFENEEMRAAAQTYQTRQIASQGLHFLLVQPDDSGRTYSGFWLLQRES